MERSLFFRDSHKHSRKTTQSRSRFSPGSIRSIPFISNLWVSNPAFPKVDEMPITLRAIYQVSPTREASEHKVWTGRVESHGYHFQDSTGTDMISRVATKPALLTPPCDVHLK